MNEELLYGGRIYIKRDCFVESEFHLLFILFGLYQEIGERWLCCRNSLISKNLIHTKKIIAERLRKQMEDYQLHSGILIHHLQILMVEL